MLLYFRFSSVRVFVDEDEDENVHLAKSIIVIILRGNDPNAIGFFVSSQWDRRVLITEEEKEKEDDARFSDSMLRRTTVVKMIRFS